MLLDTIERFATITTFDDTAGVSMDSHSSSHKLDGCESIESSLAVNVQLVDVESASIEMLATSSFTPCDDDTTSLSFRDISSISASCWTGVVVTAVSVNNTGDVDVDEIDDGDVNAVASIADDNVVTTIDGDNIVTAIAVVNEVAAIADDNDVTAIADVNEVAAIAEHAVTTLTTEELFKVDVVCKLGKVGLCVTELVGSGLDEIELVEQDKSEVEEGAT